MPTPKLTPAERNARFWTFVDKNGPVHPALETPCWLWTGYRMPRGYGNFQSRDPKIGRLAHRYAYAAFVGSIPDGMGVLHRCDTPPCCRPDHLFLGTDQDNIDDKVAKGRQSRGVERGLRLKQSGQMRKKLTASQEEDIRQAVQSAPRHWYKGRPCLPDGFALGLAEQYGVSWARIYQIGRSAGEN